jgi:octaprenyl-diphosphate synthase
MTMDALENLGWYHELVKDAERVVGNFFDRTGSAELKTLLQSQHQGGKRLRPLIIGASAQLSGYHHPGLPYAAAAIELFHMATLFHDDVIDETAIRRHHLSSGKQYGNIRSILAGDYLLTESIDLLLTHTTPEVTRDFLKTLRIMVRSEITSYKDRWNFRLRRDEYLKIIDTKTAVLFAFSSGVGSRLGGGSAELIASMTEYGHHIGMAYQLVDDLHDMMGLIDDGDHDLKNGYLALPLIDLLAAIPASDVTAVQSFLQSGRLEGYREILRWMKSFSIFPSTLSTIRYHLNQAEVQLDKITIDATHTETLTALRFLLSYLQEKTVKLITEYERLAEEPKPVMAVAIGGH